MKNWTIARRISLGFSVVLFITLIIGAVSYSRLRVIKGGVDSLFSDSFPGIEIITKIQANAREDYALAEKVLLTKDAAQLEQIARKKAAIREQNGKAYRDYEKTIAHAEDRALYETVLVARANFIKATESVTNRVGEGSQEAAFQAFVQTADPAFEQYDATLEKMVDYNRANGDADRERITTAIVVSNRFIEIGLGVALVLAVAVAILITRGVNRTLRITGGTLDSSAEQVTAAANQVSASSQSLAEGASEQAASLEETSASLEEVSSMSKRNADNARQAKELAGQSRLAADSGTAEMNAMKLAMDEIKASSAGIAKIIKSIDEIAFQTNILALNAAVEAARAGEAGQGFAVVADEVRSLAQRSAQSAKETAAQIEVAIAKSERGVLISDRVAKSLADILEKTRRVDALVSEIAAASEEQTQGVGQVNTAVGQMDKVTQNNASSAEETAAAAEELNSQSLLMREAVGDLMKLISGDDQRHSARPARPATAARMSNGKAPASRSNGRMPEALTVSVNGGRNHRSSPPPVVPASEAVADMHFQDS